MIRRLALATFALALSANFAFAAAITLTVATKTFSTTITAGNATRFGAWAAAMYPTIPNPAYNPALPVDPVTNPQTIPNPEPAITALQQVYQGIKDNVTNWEREQAKAAVATPAPIN